MHEKRGNYLVDGVYCAHALNPSMLLKPPQEFCGICSPCLWSTSSSSGQQAPLLTEKQTRHGGIQRLRAPILYSGLGDNVSMNSSLWLLCPACLRQRRLGLRQPEGHVHGAVELDGSRKFSTGLLPLAYPGIQPAE